MSTAPTAPPLDAPTRRALGLRARKQLARSAHAAFQASACPQPPLEVLFAAERGRLPALLRLKHQRMAASAFGFFRGAVPIMAADLAAHPNTGLFAHLCGDAHVSNLGAFASADGALVFDINDFDESLPGPFEFDVKRLATSLLLAGAEAHLRPAALDVAVLHFLATYRRRMRAFAELPILELARWQIHRLAKTPPMPAIFAQAERSTPLKSLAALTEPIPSPAHRKRKKPSRHPDAAHADAALPASARLKAPVAGAAFRAAWKGTGFRPSLSAAGKIGASAPEGTAPRRFQSHPPLLTPLKPRERDAVLASLNDYALTLQPERRHLLSLYTPIDVAFKVVGTGSVGLRDFCVYLEGTHAAHPDPLFLQIKEEAPSAYAAWLPQSAALWSHNGRRAMDGQRAMQLTSDPFLGYTTVLDPDGRPRDFLVRSLNDHKAALDLTTLTAASLYGYAELCGELFARGHARSGDPVAIAAYLGRSSRFDEALLAFAHAYARKTRQDWQLLKKSLKH